jgi:hypothetical protein
MAGITLPGFLLMLMMLMTLVAPASVMLGVPHCHGNEDAEAVLLIVVEGLIKRR